MEDDELSLRDYAAILRRRKWWIIISVLVITGAAVSFSVTQNDRYRASGVVLVQDPASASSIDQLENVVSGRLINNELQRAKGSTLQDLVREEIGEEPELSVKLAAASDVDVLVFTATSRDANGAANAANAYVETYVGVRRKAFVEELDARSAVLRSRLDEVTQQLSTADGSTDTVLLAQQDQYQRDLESLTASASLASSTGASVIDAAQTPTDPYSPKPLRDGALALVVSGLVGIGLALLAEYRDNSTREPEALSKASGLPVLAVIPKAKLGRKDDPNKAMVLNPRLRAIGESYRGLRTSLQFLGIEGELRVIQVTSPTPGDGKTSTAANLAVVYALSGQTVALVDCDLRKPRIHEVFDLPNESGFTTVVGKMTESEPLQPVLEVPGLSVITSGPIPPNPSEILGRERTGNLFSWLRERFDVVIVDSPPVLVVPDPLVVSAHVDGVILVAAASSTDVRQVTDAAEHLAQIDAPMIGTVLNAVDTRKNSGYKYRYAYGEYGEYSKE